VPYESTQRCPFLDDPCEECHVANLTSGAVERAIIYCGSEYKQCEIYRLLVVKRRQRGCDGNVAEPSNQAGEEDPATGKKEPQR